MDGISTRLCTATIPYSRRRLAPKLSTSGASPPVKMVGGAVDSLATWR